jgi:hypothetical protein
VAFRTKGLLLSVIGGSDYRRWSCEDSLKESWRSRTAFIAKLIPPGSRVIEFGAGKRQLQQHLDATCSYVPSDIVHRGPGTLICDLNVMPLPDLGPHDVDTAVFSGVLEYVHDLPHLFAWLGCHVRRCVFSYHCARGSNAALKRWGERVRRLGHGWINACSEDELCAMWTSAGFDCADSAITSGQKIFVLRKHFPR